MSALYHVCNDITEEVAEGEETAPHYTIMSKY